MDVRVTGSSGLIGTALRHAARARRAIGRSRSCGPAAPARRGLHWDPTRARSTPPGSRASTRSCTSPGRASATSAGPPSRSSRIVESRIGPDDAARRDARRARSRPPAVLVSGSAVGWYGDRGDEVLTEASPPPTPPDFLADVCRAVGGRDRAGRGARASARCTSAPASCSQATAARSTQLVAAVQARPRWPDRLRGRST